MPASGSTGPAGLLRVLLGAAVRHILAETFLAGARQPDRRRLARELGGDDVALGPSSAYDSTTSGRSRTVS